MDNESQIRKVVADSPVIDSVLYPSILNNSVTIAFYLLMYYQIQLVLLKD